MGNVRNMEWRSVFFIFLTIIVISTTGCTLNSGNDASGYYEYYYEVHVIAESEYYLLLPIPVIDPEPRYNVNESVSRLIDDIQMLKGDCGYHVENTKFGHALNITSTSDLHLKAYIKIFDENDEKQNEYFFNDLSMKDNNSRREHFIYSSTNITIKNLKCYTGHVGSLDADYPYWIQTQEVKIKYGWNSIEVD